MEEIVTAAAKALGTPLSHAEELLSGGRTTVLRCRADDRTSVIVKAFRQETDALRGFTAEAAGLALGAGGPRLLAVDMQTPLIVMEDLGTAPGLADRLLGTSASQAREALLTWAGGLGRLAAAGAGREAEFTDLQQRYDLGHGGWLDQVWHADRCASMPGLLSDLDLKTPPGLAADLDDALTVTDPAHFPVFSPGDVCPDNNLLTAHGLRVFDFEGAGFRSVFLDAAYTRMPFATCWCVFQMPDDLASEVEQAYRKEVAGVYPELADDAVWREGVMRATVVWTVAMTTLLMPSLAVADRPSHPNRTPVPSLRQILRHRWQVLHDTLAAADTLPAVAEAMRGLLGATEVWQVAPLPLYPALR